MILIAVILLLAAFLLRHPLVSSAFGLLALLLILGALVGLPGVVVIVGAAAVVVLGVLGLAR